MLHRIFLAINLPDSAKKKLLEYQQNVKELFTPYHPDEGGIGSGPARWAKPDNLHVTLMFLGNTSDAELKEAGRVAKEVASRHGPFSFSLDKIVYGPSLRQPRMIWAIGETPKELASLQKDLAGALQQEEEHPFSLHITLARISELEFRKMEPEERPGVNKNISLEIQVSSFEVMESKLKRTGAEYTIIESIPLET